MDTTLVTFLFKAPPKTRSVELLGSWDNFSRPYRMSRDSLRGSRFWSGIHRFENVIFDGDRPDWHKPRNGALKQGGRYWYYYRLDDDEDFCDSSQDQTKDCPLLPGQRLNVLDVPMEVIQPPSRSRSASADFVSFFSNTMTLEPNDRYQKVYRQPPTKLPRQYASSEGLQSPDVSMEDYKPVHPMPPASCFQRPLPSATSVVVTSVEVSATAHDPPGSVQSHSFGPSPVSAEAERPSSRHGSPASSSRSFESMTSFYSFAGSSLLDRRHDAWDVPESIEHDSGPLARAYKHEAGLGIRVGGTALHSEIHLLKQPSTFRPLQVDRSVQDSQSNTHDNDGLDAAITCLTDVDQSPNSDSHGFDICSPTFTADTLSSTGFNTPYRLSLQEGQDSTTIYEKPTIVEHDQDSMSDSMIDVSRRLSRLHTGHEAECSHEHSYHLGRRPSPISLSHKDDLHYTHLTPRTLLANQAKTSSELTLEKPNQTLTTPSSGYGPSVAGLGSQNDSVDNSTTSLADDIFGELGYLGSVIS